MDDRELQHLTDGFLAGELTRDEIGRLGALLSQDGPATGEIARQMQLHGALAHLGAAPFDVDATMALLPQARASDERSVMAYVRSNGPRSGAARAGRRRAWWLGWTVAAATGALAAGLLLIGNRPSDRAAPVAESRAEIEREMRHEPTPATPRPGAARSTPMAVAPPLVVASATGRVLGFSGTGVRPLVAGSPLVPGEGLMTVGRDSQAGLDLGLGSHVEIGADSVAPTLARESEPGHHVLVARGSVVARTRLTPQRPLVIATPHAVIELGAAQVRVQVGAEATQIAVSSGQVRLAGRDSRIWKDVPAGQQALTAADGTITTSARTGRRVLFITGTRSLRPSDQEVKARLDQLGTDVTTALPISVGNDQARESDLIIISETISPKDVDEQLRDLPVPILTWEPGLYPLLGMVAGSCEADQCGWSGKRAMAIKNPGHALAAGFSGVVELPGWRSLPWGIPAAAAVLIATPQNDPGKSILFAYERGVTMAGLAAPARRVGFFFGEMGTGPTKTDPVWKLFDQAVNWCLGNY